VAFSDAHTLMLEQNRDALKRDAGEQQLDREGVAGAMRVAIGNARKFENATQRSLPISNCAF
jgi:hypothetical protein